MSRASPPRNISTRCRRRIREETENRAHQVLHQSRPVCDLDTGIHARRHAITGPRNPTPNSPSSPSATRRTSARTLRPPNIGRYWGRRRRARRRCAVRVIPTLTGGSSGEARMDRAGAILSCTHRRSLSRERFARRRGLMTFCAAPGKARRCRRAPWAICAQISMTFRNARIRPSSTRTTRTGRIA